MNGYWLLEDAGYWLSLGITVDVAVSAVMTSKNPGVAFATFGVLPIFCLLLNHSVMKMLGMPDAEVSDERRTINVYGFLIAMVVSGGVSAPVGYFIAV